ncbi:MAG: hypothetical protein KAX44_02330 [Candidatus Brocadiae bacterium]|nr:hypothetical protein [Candidatus Brocadiia bacterium]
MTGKEKMRAAFSEHGTAEIPAVLSCYEDIFQRDHWESLTQYPWWYRYEVDIEKQMLWRREAIANTGEDWFRLPFCAPAETRQRQQVVETPEGVFLIDRETGSKRQLRSPPAGDWPEQGYKTPGTLPETPDAIDRMIPISDDGDYAYVRTEGRDDLARRLLDEFGDRLFPNHRTSSPLLRCADLWGFDNMMLNIKSRPDLVTYACKRYLEQAKCRMRRAALLGAQGIWVVDALADMISPDDYAKLSLPHLQDLIDEIRNVNMRSIYYFTGDPAGKWDLILSMGADALAFEDSKKGFDVDVVEVARKLRGECALFGNLNAIDVLQNGTDEQLKKEVKRQLTAAPLNGGRFVMSLGSPITPATSVARVRLYCDLVHDLGGSQ